MDGQKICQDDPFSATQYFPHMHAGFQRMLIDFQAMVQLDNLQTTT